MRLLTLMEDLGYPKDIVELFGDIYTNSTASSHDNHFSFTPPNPKSRSTMQGDTLSPYLFLDPLL